ncbi:MAG: hypothetical protein JO290_01520 [Sphingomonadaceae bacterium]|nr:hypothetical protein [Sphingomonadaceae bacterium]
MTDRDGHPAAPHHHRRHYRHRHHATPHGPAHLPPPAHPRVAASTPPPGEFALWWHEVEDELKAVYLAHAGRATDLLRRWFDHDAPAPGTAYGVPPPAPKATGHRLGNLSMQHETGHFPGEEAAAAATVSDGKGDPGGKSYGAYQLNSARAKGAVVLTFLREEGARWAPGFAGTDPTVAGAFEREWKRIAAAEPDAFFAAQHDFIKRSHYDRVVTKVLKEAKIDIDKGGDAVRDVVWSMSVQHGGAAKIVETALGKVAGMGHIGERDYDRTLINALYDAREAYVIKIKQPGLVKRYKKERANALKMLDASGAGHP